jgi:hypothetical protein
MISQHEYSSELIIIDKILVPGAVICMKGLEYIIQSESAWVRYSNSSYAI